MPQPTAHDIENLIVTKIAQILDTKPEEIDSRQPLGSFNIDSVAAVAISGDLEEFLGRRLKATLFFDHPNIRSLAQALAGDTMPSKVNN